MAFLFTILINLQLSIEDDTFLLHHRHKVINISLSSGKVPKLCKYVLVHPVCKGGEKDPCVPGFYRPIAILHALSKILETVVRDSLLGWLEQHSLLPQSQYGFRPKRSVAMAIA